MNTLRTLADLIAEYEEELAETKREFMRAYRKALRESGLSYRELEQLTGLTGSYLCNIARRKHKLVSANAAEKIAAAFEALDGTLNLLNSTKEARRQ